MTNNSEVCVKTTFGIKTSRVWFWEANLECRSHIWADTYGHVPMRNTILPAHPLQYEISTVAGGRRAFRSKSKSKQNSENIKHFHESIMTFNNKHLITRNGKNLLKRTWPSVASRRENETGSRFTSPLLWPRPYPYGCDLSSLISCFIGCARHGIFE